MKYTLFAVQVFLDLRSARPLRQQLHGMLRGTPPHASYDDKRAFYEGFATALASWSGEFVHGVWDYVEDSERAEKEYHQWREGTVVDARSAAEEHGPGEPGTAYRRAAATAGSTFMFATLLFLMRRGGTSDRFVCEECRMPEAEHFRRATLGRLIERVPLLNFPSVRADTVFVRPGQDDVGVTQEELEEPHYTYLRRLT